MATESENPKPERSRGSQRGGASRRRGRRWFRLRLPRMFDPLVDWLYDFWFPVSERSHGHYGYAGPSRQNRVKWLWRRLRRLVRNSFAGSAFGALKNRWHDWWYPASNEGQTYSSHYGGERRHRLVRDWRQLKRFVLRSFVGRVYKKLEGRFSDWWYPPNQKKDAYPGHDYGHRRRSRLQLAWNSSQQRVHSSRLGRKCRAWADAFLDWYFPLVKSSGGYSYGTYHRVSRPVWLTRCGIRWFRRTWLGRKMGWVLDEVEELFIPIRRSAAQNLGLRGIQRRLKRWQTWVTLACLFAAMVFGYKYGLPRYRQYVERNYAMQAQRYAASGDFSRALLRARQVLVMNPDDTAGIRVIADLADYFGSPYALQWRQRLVVLNPDATNRLALARTALRTEAFPFPTATMALNEIAPAYRQNPAYQIVAGTLAIQLNDLPAAEQHFAEAQKLNPDDPINRMSLAVVHLQSGNPNLIKDSRTTLELLRTDRRLGLLADRSLVAESAARGDYGRAETISQQILTNQQASFSDRIMHLAILNVEKSPNFQTFLGETKKSAEENPFYVGELVSWMNRYGLAQQALDWVNGLPARLNKQGGVPIAIADSYVALGQWKGLTGYLQKERWLELDPVRIGLMSFASWKENDSKRYSSPIWQQAVQLGARSSAALNTLARMAAGWGWKEETEDVLWFAAGKYPGESWPLTDLENLYAGQHDTAGLRRVYRAMVRQNPKDALARNNFAMVSLLMGADVAEARRTAAELQAAEPDNPVFASTHAFSLYLQGRPQEAAQVLRALGLNRLDDPSLAAYYGIFLSASGDTQTARIYLNKSSNAFLLPEEQALVARAKQTL